jgi:hypothetical protein
VSARAEPRFTRDIDAAVLVDSDSAGEALVRSLLADKYRLLASIEQEETGRLATVRLGSPPAVSGDVVVDLLFASSGIEPEIVRASEMTEIVSGLNLPIATTGHLIALNCWLEMTRHVLRIWETCVRCGRSPHQRIGRLPEKRFS